ncbi:MAG: hypothetical protein K2Q18_06410, partial [Bdellovibrionales bacterium]|nr:hypothetical protein [Bdellovibrionales bacterium]
LVTLTNIYTDSRSTQRDYDLTDSVPSFKGMLKVIKDFPLSDVAFLEFSGEGLTVQAMEKIKEIALLNGQITNKSGWTPGTPGINSSDTVSAVLKGKRTNIESVVGFRARMVEDVFISGDKSMIWLAPIYGMPGVSGGAYYNEGILQGLVTKISLSGEPIILATPFSKVAKLAYSSDPMERLVSWEDAKLVYSSKDKTISLNPLSNGWLGNGGELLQVDPSETGDSNPNYWRIQLKNYFRTEVVNTWDPFVYRSGNFAVNDSSVSFVRVKNKGFFKGKYLYRIPTLANFIASEKTGDEQTLLQNTSQNLSVLKEERIKRKTNISRLKIYKFDHDKRYFKLLSNSAAGDPLESDGFGLTPRVSDRDKYIYRRDYATIGSRISDKTIFDVKLTDLLLDYGNHMLLMAPVDHSKVTIKNFNLNRQGTDYVTTEIVLNPVEINSPQSVVFKSEDGAHKAIFMYTNDDLTKLAKIFLVTGDLLIELWAEK